MSCPNPPTCLATRRRRTGDRRDARSATPFAAFLPLNGFIAVLENETAGADGDLYPGNLVNKPFFVVNGGRDPLYPVQHVQTHVDVLKQLGVPLVFSPQPAAGHDTTWWRWERTPAKS